MHIFEIDFHTKTKTEFALHVVPVWGNVCPQIWQGTFAPLGGMGAQGAPVSEPTPSPPQANPHRRATPDSEKLKNLIQLESAYFVNKIFKVRVFIIDYVLLAKVQSIGKQEMIIVL